MPPVIRHPSGRSPSSRSPSKSPSPDPDLVRFLNEQKRPASPDSEAFRNKRIATSGVFNVKSRHQREKEEAEKKQKDEEELRKKTYEEFVLDMQGDDGGSVDSRRGFVRAGSSSSYDPKGNSGRPHIVSEAPTAPKSMRALDSAVPAFGGEDEEEADNENASSSRRKDPPGKRLQVMGDFLGELQRNQAEREERLKPKVSSNASISTLLAQETGGPSKPWDSSDPSSSNVCVLNLPANVTEDIFGEYFSQYGDVASVKIIWPRTADDLIAPNLRSTKTPGATGFVNFMYRSDAERAYREIEGSEWNGSLLRTGWGKALRKPAVVPFKQSDRARDAQIGSHSAKETGSFAEQKRSSRSPSRRKHRRMRAHSPPPKETLEKMIVDKAGPEALKTIESVASRVKEYGKSFEAMLQERESNNPLYQFLSDHSSMQYEYYRSLLDERYEPIMPAMPFQDDGDASLYSSDTEEESERERLQKLDRGKVLGKVARRRLEALLRGITLRRERIARVMLFAIDHASAAVDVCDIIIESLMQPQTPLSRKLARLYVISDILHNSSASASNAWRYRSLFETKLDRVFIHWRDVSNSFSGRIKRESCKEMVRNTLNVWENWLVYENAKIASWRDCIDLEQSSNDGVEPHM